jgi:hypothetical protein
VSPSSGGTPPSEIALIGTLQVYPPPAFGLIPIAIVAI